MISNYKFLTFLVQELLSFQSETMFSKISKSKILTHPKCFRGTLGPPNFDTKNVHDISLCKKNLGPLSQMVSKWEPLELHIFQGRGGGHQYLIIGHGQICNWSKTLIFKIFYEIIQIIKNEHPHFHHHQPQKKYKPPPLPAPSHHPNWPTTIDQPKHIDINPNSLPL